MPDPNSRSYICLDAVAAHLSKTLFHIFDKSKASYIEVVRFLNYHFNIKVIIYIYVFVNIFIHNNLNNLCFDKRYATPIGPMSLQIV